MVMDLGQRTALRARIALRERVFAVTPDANHLVAVDVDKNPAHRGADAAEAVHRSHDETVLCRRGLQARP